jgi:catechol 2,3-dioxygenase-like lactoylglutathione lyase family enzyme
MTGIGDVQVYVSDFQRSLRFWADGLALQVAQREQSRTIGYARLEFPEGGPAIELIGPVAPWEPDERPPPGARPMMRFDILTTDFDGTLARLLECGGTQEDQIETYNDLRVVTLADPDGNSFELAEVPQE